MRTSGGEQGGWLSCRGCQREKARKKTAGTLVASERKELQINTARIKEKKEKQKTEHKERKRMGLIIPELSLICFWFYNSGDRELSWFCLHVFRDFSNWSFPFKNSPFFPRWLCFSPSLRPFVHCLSPLSPQGAERLRFSLFVCLLTSYCLVSFHMKTGFRSKNKNLENTSGTERTLDINSVCWVE